VKEGHWIDWGDCLMKITEGRKSRDTENISHTNGQADFWDGHPIYHVKVLKYFYDISGYKEKKISMK
jgi:hypothetical protein